MDGRLRGVAVALLAGAWIWACGGSDDPCARCTGDQACVERVCVDPMPRVDAGSLDSGADAGAQDAGTDAGLPDAGGDAGAQDAGADAGLPDAGGDAGAQDAGADAGLPDAGGDAGAQDAGTACRQLAGFSAPLAFGDYKTDYNGLGFDFALYRGVSPATPPSGLLQFELSHPTGTTWPVPASSANIDLAAQGTFGQCRYCVWLGEACAQPLSFTAQCARTYLARSGQTTVTQATPNSAAGTFAFTLSAVRFEAWDLGTDLPVDGGCVEVPAASLTGSWP